jgi:RNA polymerase sigma factor (TIGR02999 family)
MDDPRQCVTEILRDLDLSDPHQADRLLAIVYAELRTLAGRHLRGERRGHTLQPTALVHEAYLRLVDGEAIGWDSRAHFFGAAARAMRRVLVDHARRRDAVKRGGAWERVTLATDLRADARTATDLLDLHEALERLAALDPERARLVELRFFAGLTLDEAADVLGVSRRKAAKDWAATRLWLLPELDAG